MRGRWAPRAPRQGREGTRRPAKMKQNLLQVAAARAQPACPVAQLVIPRPRPCRQFGRRAPDPTIDGVGVQAVEAEQQHAVRDLGADTGECNEPRPSLIDRIRPQSIPRPPAARDFPRGPEQVRRPKSKSQLAKVGLAHPGDRLGRRKGAPRRSLDRIAPSAGHPFDTGRDLPDVRGGGADERRERLPRLLAQEPKAQERQKSWDRAKLLGVLEVHVRVLVEPQVVPKRLLAGVFAAHLDRHGPRPIAPGEDLGASEDAAPCSVLSNPAEGLAAGERQLEIERPQNRKRVSHSFHRVKIYTIPAAAARFPLTLREIAWEDRSAPMNRPSIVPAPLAAALLTAASALLVALATAFLTLPAPAGAGPGSATGSADVRLVRLLDDIPDWMHARGGPIHDLRVRLVPGNVLVFRKGGEFATLLPIERVAGSPDSLRYFFYVEKPALFWIISGARTKGIRTVADGDSMQFDSFRLLWGRDNESLGWIYFPDTHVNQHLRFSVVSGQSVDEADPKNTKYWVELGAEGESGF